MIMVETVYFSDRKDWRKWLSENFDKKKEIWLVLPKLSSGEKRIPYNDTVEEALCFGWIDSIQRPYDEHHTIQRFSPRRKNSNWAQTNIERLKWLDQQGMLHPSVKESVKDLLQRKFVFPEDILAELKRDPIVWRNYQAFSEPYKRIRIAFIDGARDRPDEFRKRLNNFIEKTRSNKKFGYGGIEKYY
jgi:uncharacterized protein YdeI (YjbR/CyaY-like superfamily)